MKSIAKQWLEKYKQTLKCSSCDEDDVICLSFHHLDPDNKVASVCQLVNDKNCTIEQLQAEMSKCIVLCFNCHMKYHRDKRDYIKFNDVEELPFDLLEGGLYSLWSQDDDGNEGLYN